MSTQRGGSPLDLYLGRQGRAASGGTTPDSGVENRPEMPLLMLDLVVASGDRVGLPYSHLAKARITGNTAIELEYPECRVVIKGRNLAPVYANILAHTAKRITASETKFDGGDGETWIEAIVVTEEPLR